MNITLDDKEVHMLISILSKIDPCGIFVNNTLDKILKQAQAQQSKEEVKLQEKK